MFHRKKNGNNYITKDYFFRKDQKINQEAKDKDSVRWEKLKKKVEIAIDGDIVVKIVNKAQRLKLTVQRNGVPKLVSNLNEIGEAFKKDDSIQLATKINEIFTVDFTFTKYISVKSTVKIFFNFCGLLKKHKL